MKIKKLLVYELFNKRPFIMLKGKWLQELGFNPHDLIELKLYKNKIIIKKLKVIDKVP